ncbi:MAG: hypothetical protein ACE5HX_17895, partial [bacterium]
KQVPFAIFSDDYTDCIEFSILSVGMPFVFGERPVIGGVNDGIFAPGEGDSAEGVAVADVTIGKYGHNQYPFNRCWDVYDNPNDATSIRREKFEILSTKSETNSNDRNSNLQTCCFEHSGFEF